MRRSLRYKLLPLPYLLGGMWAIWRLSRRRRYDVVHVHWPVPHALFGWVARLFGRARIVSSWYGVELRWVQSSLPWLRWFVRWALKISDAVVAISSYTAGEIARFARTPVRVIPYTLGFAPAAAHRSETTGQFGILFVGRLVERKGVTHLIEAVRRLPAEIRPRLTLIGDGPERAPLEAQIARDGLGDRVAVRGRVSEAELRDAYAASKVLVLPSILDARGDTEGLGVVLLEAMSYGVPVIGSDLGGITDIVRNGETGLLVPPGDPDALSGALQRVARDSGLASRLGEAGRAHVATAFGWPAIMAQWEECYASAAAAGTRTGTATPAAPGAMLPPAKGR